MSGRRAREVRRRKAEMVQELLAGGWATRCVWRRVQKRIRHQKRIRRLAARVARLFPVRSPLALPKSGATIQWRVFNG